MDFVVKYYFSHSIHCTVNFVSDKSSFASCKTVTYFEHFKAVMLIYEEQQCACVYGSLQGSQNSIQVQNVRPGDVVCVDFYKNDALGWISQASCLEKC